MAMKNFKVCRLHIGDKTYAVGETRRADENEVKHLVSSGVLKTFEAEAEAPLERPAKAELKNKADKPAETK